MSYTEIYTNMETLIQSTSKVLYAHLDEYYSSIVTSLDNEPLETLCKHLDALEMVVSCEYEGMLVNLGLLTNVFDYIEDSDDLFGNPKIGALNIKFEKAKKELFLAYSEPKPEHEVATIVMTNKYTKALATHLHNYLDEVAETQSETLDEATQESLALNLLYLEQVMDDHTIAGDLAYVLVRTVVDFWQSEGDLFYKSKDIKELHKTLGIFQAWAELYDLV